MSTQIPPPEAGFSLTFKLIDDHGIENLITMRATSPTGWGKVLDERSTLVSTLVEKGWTTHGKPLPAPQAPQSSQPASNGNGQQHYEQGDGTFEDFEAESLIVAFNPKGDKGFKIGGGKYKKFGVTVWPEILERMGVNAGKLDVGTHQFKGKVRVLLVDGKPRKILGFAFPDTTAGGSFNEQEPEAEDDPILF